MSTRWRAGWRLITRPSASIASRSRGDSTGSGSARRRSRSMLPWWRHEEAAMVTDVARISGADRGGIAAVQPRHVAWPWIALGLSVALTGYIFHDSIAST